MLFIVPQAMASPGEGAVSATGFQPNEEFLNRLLALGISKNAATKVDSIGTIDYSTIC